MRLLDPDAVTTTLVTLCVGWFMTSADLKKSALELRRRRRICPACGRNAPATG